MMRYALTILAVTLVLTRAVAAASPPGSKAAAMLRKVQESASVKNHPEEFNNFIDVITSAEIKLQEGDHAGAEQMFLLAIVKGGILLDHAREDNVQQAVFRQWSGLGTTAVDPPPRQIEQQLMPAAEPAASAAAAPRKVSARIVGGEGMYVTRKRESLKLIASRLGVRLRDLARMNGLKTDATVTAGQSLRYNNRRIVPRSIRNGIVVNIPDRNLYVFRNGRVFANYPVALGISKKGDSTIWRTPTGKFRIVEKKENPAWRIPVSIQKEMEENGEEVVAFVPPGTKNPLGKYAMRTTLAGILIHSTTRPASINSYSSHGCIRVMPEHMERLFRTVTIPTAGEIIYQPVKVEVTENRQVFLEVNRDSYEMVEDLAAEVKRVLKKYHAANLVSWQKVQQVVAEKAGIAEDVTLQSTPD
ncbi:MAG: ErfK/YbiS/YcfS/YnhG family protein [Deltaproteobacteria bacterium]|nr:ErfK/YbiS/YcfS/YnhG family protein [Deltaproteobacteria bacterium]